VVLLVALRLGLGVHFLYEGVWKINHPVAFAAETEGFLTGARGPLAGVFYAMVPDIDGRQRLAGKPEKVAVEKETTAGKLKKVEIEVVKNEARTHQWQAIRDQFVARHPDLKEKAEEVCAQQLLEAEAYLGENGDDIQTYLTALDRFEESKKSSPSTAFQTKRNWDTMRSLRSEAKVWLADLDARRDAYKDKLAQLLGSESAADAAFPPCWNPLAWSQMELIRFAITWGLTAIGVCLLLGLCTRPAAIGGGLFMLFVVMSQPSYPGVIPPDPPQLGHALLVNKDFIEMLALFLIASTAVGHWGGLDYFLDRFIVQPFLSKTVCRCKKEAST